MIRAVVDPNVLIAALLSPEGAPAQLLRNAVAGDYVVVSCLQLVEEFEDVARRDKFHGIIAETNIPDTSRSRRSPRVLVLTRPSRGPNAAQNEARSGSGRTVRNRDDPSRRSWAAPGPSHPARSGRRPRPLEDVAERSGSSAGREYPHRVG